MAMTLDEFTRTINPLSLPRVLQIQSGVYFQGSVYEMFGRECCLPTGEVMKIIGISIATLTASVQQEGSVTSTITLPLDYPGLFRIMADRKPYLTIREITESLRIGGDRLGRPEFRCSGRLRPADGPLREGESFVLVSPAKGNGDGAVECEVMRGDTRHRFMLGLMQEGEFYECEDDQFYTLKELAEWKMPRGRLRTVTLAKALPRRDVFFCDLLENYTGELILSPVYELQAVMKYRKDVVRIPSNLDVEVIDVTGHWDSECFLQPLSLSDVFKKPSEEFPLVAEVIEAPLHVQEEFGFLKHCKKLIIHSTCKAKRILASEIRSDAQRHFLIPVSYRGRFKRRPREFPTAYDLEVAKRDKEQLHVVATRAFESRYEGLSTVFVGDQYLVRGRETSEVIYGGTRKMVEALACEKIEGKNYESVLIPMCLDGGFVEVIHDKKQYSIADICTKFHLPFNVKVSVRDLSVREDMLAAVPGLRLEEEITDPYLLVSDPELSECWEVPVNRTHLTVVLVHGGELENHGPQPVMRAAVEEIGEDCYYTLRRYATATVLPPPRPPKKPRQPELDATKLLPQPQRNGTPGSPKSPHLHTPKPASAVSPAFVEQCCPVLRPETKLTPKTGAFLNPAQQKALSQGKCVEDTSSNDDDDKHDYEYIDENEMESIRTKFQLQSINSTVRGKPANTYEQSV
ncbi:protein THEMIS isoform X2 [Scleropages formosus]|uniref:Thymocyte selection associated n=1 Tax=Scleropages formosus TaxID=113540 RepID=A0A8C9V731_SCLFO|nr:protein THEMIS isoform X2 [Scleropages formosus]